MQARQKQDIEAYQRVQGFLGAHPLPPPADYGEPKQLLDDVVVRLTEHSRTQVTGAGLKRAGKENEVTLRQVLLTQHLKPITLIAQAQLSGTPGIEQALVMPSGKLPTVKLIATAASFHEAAAPYENIFVRAGRPADFLAQLDAAAEALHQAFLARQVHLGTQVGAAAGLDEEIARGRRAIKMLDAIVLTTFAGESDVLARWRSARRVRRTTGSGSSGSSTSTTTPAPGTSTTPSAGATPTSTGATPPVVQPPVPVPVPAPVPAPVA